MDRVVGSQMLFAHLRGFQLSPVKMLSIVVGLSDMEWDSRKYLQNQNDLRF